jgi:segregation and condensation protein B
MSSELQTEHHFEGPAAVADGDIRVLEALLFASAQPLTTKELHERMPKGADVGGALMALQKQYEGRGITLHEAEGQWAFRTAADVGPALAIDRQVERKLSRAAMETLAIIAYHQPVTRAEVENIRGVVTHKGTLDALMEMGWIKPGRRRETPGRPLTWVTTPEFLDHFALAAITDLPGLEELKAAGLLDKRPAIDAIPSADLFDRIVDEEQRASDRSDDGFDHDSDDDSDDDDEFETDDESDDDGEGEESFDSAEAPFINREESDA